MSASQRSFSLRHRGNAKAFFRRANQPINKKSASSSEKSVRFNLDWQSGKSLAECNKKMLQDSYLADVMFHVGKGKQREMIKAHKFVLASRSSLFFSKFCVDNGTENVFTVEDIEPSTFSILLGYIYTDEVELSTKTVIPLMYAAKKYKLQGLVTKCVEKISEDINTESVCTLLEHAHKYKENQLEKNCLQYIFKNAHEVFKTTSFQNVCSSCLQKVMQSDELKADESKVYEAVYDWSTKECKRHKLAPTSDNRSRVLGKLIYLVRFPILDLEYFSDNVHSQGLLTKDETIQLFQYFHSRTSPSVGPFISRRRALTRVTRFETTSGAWNVGNYNFDSIRFQSSMDIMLQGIVIYGCFSDRSEYDISVRILNSKQEIMVRNDVILETDAKTELYDILFKNGIGLNAMTWYTILLHMEGPQTKRGVCGKDMIYCEQVQFMFKDSGLSRNCTTEKEGQIPGILFH